MNTVKYSFLSPNDKRESIKMRTECRTTIFFARWTCWV